jgi:hypothetical protein
MLLYTIRQIMQLPHRSGRPAGEPRRLIAPQDRPSLKPCDQPADSTTEREANSADAIIPGEDIGLQKYGALVVAAEERLATSPETQAAARVSPAPTDLGDNPADTAPLALPASGNRRPLLTLAAPPAEAA